MNQWVGFRGFIAFLTCVALSGAASAQGLSFDALVAKYGPENAMKSAHFADVRTKAAELASRYGAENVLIAIDIDNTLLAMNQGLGSDQWYTWQAGMITQPQADQSFAVAGDISALLGWVRKIYALSGMHPPEVNQPKLVQEMQVAGHPVIALTSRGYRSRSATERELTRAGYDLNQTAIGPAKGYPGNYLPYDAKDWRASGLDKGELKKFGLVDAQGKSKARPVSYQNGIFMGAGQHKGIMLRTLTHKAKNMPWAVIFVDDHLKHSVRMQAAYEDSSMDVYTYLYTAEAPEVKAFNDEVAAAIAAKKKPRSVEAFEKLKAFSDGYLK